MLAARIASRSPSTSSASAPSASARCAASGPSTATISEMPSPSDMAWLRRLGPVTRRNGTSVDCFGYRGVMGCCGSRIAGRGGGAAGRRGSRGAEDGARHRSGPTSSPGRRAPTESSRSAATTGSPLSTTAASTGSRAAQAGTSSSADARDRVEPDCEVVSRRIHRDRHANPESQHESEVEPDSQTVGQTTVAVFQVGRNRTGGAASIGFSTSKDGGRTWREGTLPGLTTNTTPRGPSSRASDPVVAYDAAHGVWLANTLAIAADATRLTIHRSTDGLSWSAPTDAALSRSANLAYDKNWLTCDNGAASPFRGRCYLAYTLLVGDEDFLALQYSNDGGRTWTPAGDPAHPRHRSVPGRAAGRQARARVLVRPHRNGRGLLDRRRRQPRKPGHDLRPPRA